MSEFTATAATNARSVLWSRRRIPTYSPRTKAAPATTPTSESTAVTASDPGRGGDSPPRRRCGGPDNYADCGDDEQPVGDGLFIGSRSAGSSDHACEQADGGGRSFVDPIAANEVMVFGHGPKRVRSSASFTTAAAPSVR